MKNKKTSTLGMLVWIAYPILFVILFCLCFFTCTNKGLQAPNKQRESQRGVYAK